MGKNEHRNILALLITDWNSLTLEKFVLLSEGDGDLR
jgi:hypothetical protein